MPYGVGAFVMFGLGSLPAGRLGDHWGRRKMMLVFYFGMGASMLADRRHARAVAARRGADADGRVLVDLPSGGHSDARAWAPRPGLTIGVNGLAGNLGVALSAVTTGFLVQYAGGAQRSSFLRLIAIGARIAFACLAPDECAAAGRRRSASQAELPAPQLARIFAVLTIASVTRKPAVQFHDQRQRRAVARSG